MRNTRNSKLTSVSNPNIGLANIIIPTDMTRAEYIERVKKMGSCMIRTEKGEVVRDALVPIHMIESIEFPHKSNSVSASENSGSLVSWVRTPHYNQIMLVGIFMRTSEMNFSTEHEKNEVVTDKKGNIISDSKSVIDGKVTRTSTLRSSGGDSLGVQEIKTKGSENTTSYKQDTDGVITEHADNKKVLTALNELDLSVVDGETILAFAKLLKESSDTGEVTSSLSMDATRILLGSGDEMEPAVKGDTLVNAMSSLIDAIRIMVLNTPSGPTVSPPLNDAQFQSIQENLDLMKSTKITIE